MIALFDQEYAVKQYGNTMKQEGIKQGEKKTPSPNARTRFAIILEADESMYSGGFYYLQLKLRKKYFWIISSCQSWKILNHIYQ